MKKVDIGLRVSLGIFGGIVAGVGFITLCVLINYLAFHVIPSWDDIADFGLFGFFTEKLIKHINGELNE